MSTIKEKKNNKNLKIYILLVIIIIVSIIFDQIIHKYYKFNSIEGLINYKYRLHNKKIIDSFENDKSVFVVVCTKDECYTEDIKKVDGKYVLRQDRLNSNIYNYKRYKLQSSNNQSYYCWAGILKSDYSEMIEVTAICTEENIKVKDSSNSIFKDRPKNINGSIIPGSTKKYCFLDQMPDEYSVMFDDEILKIK